MMQIKSERRHVCETYYLRQFVYKDTPGAGFAFPCDEKGDIHDLSCGDARENYEICVRGQDENGRELVDKGVTRCHNNYVEPAVGVCGVCGEDVLLGNAMTNECEGCGTEYNGFGQQLAPREQWGWETGETAADIEGPSVR